MRLADRLRAALARPLAEGAVLYRADLPELEDLPDARPAAVLVAITDRPEPGVILTQRHAGLRDHAGQVALPGGKVDPGDASVEAAALREAWEEVGLRAADVELVGRIEPYRTGSGYLIHPVIGVVPPDLPLVRREAEVDAIFEVPLAMLFDPASWAMESAEFRGAVRHFRAMMWQEWRVWGATAAMLGNLGMRLGHV